MHIEKFKEGLPWESRVESPSCNAGDTGSVSGQGTRILYAVEQLGLCTSAGEPAHH